MAMAKLSVVIITYNEERNIARCLESVQEIADEIVVVDSNSTDKTTDIAGKYGSTIYFQEFLGHIQQKNLALEKASHTFVLSLDADEALSETLKQSIREIKENPQYNAYSFNRLTNFCGKWIRHTGWYPDRKVRLFDKSKAHWGGENPHDKIILENHASPSHLQGDLLHYSFYSIDEHVHQIDKFSTIKAREKFAKGRKAPWSYLVFAPPVKFLKHFIFKAGFRDGFYGYVISKNSAHSNFLKYAKLRAMWKDNN